MEGATFTVFVANRFFFYRFDSEDQFSFMFTSRICIRTISLMSRIERKYLLISSSYLAGLFDIFIHRGYYTVARRYRGYYTVARSHEFYVRVATTISHEWAQRTSEILFLPREHKIHIFEPPCNVLFIIWRLNKRDARNQFNKSKRRESWRHWTIRHSQRWHTENTPLGSRMKWRMESTSGLVPSKTLSSI